MKRGYTAMEYKSTVRKLRAVRPDISLSQRLHRRLPGETDDDFARTMKLIDDVGFDSSFSFVFSPRPGTPAAALHDDTPHGVKLARLQQLQAARRGARARASASRASARVQRMLVEGPSRKDASELMGRTAVQPHRQLRGRRRGWSVRWSTLAITAGAAALAARRGGAGGRSGAGLNAGQCSVVSGGRSRPTTAQQRRSQHHGAIGRHLAVAAEDAPAPPPAPPRPPAPPTA